MMSRKPETVVMAVVALLLLAAGQVTSFVPSNTPTKSYAPRLAKLTRVAGVKLNDDWNHLDPFHLDTTASDEEEVPLASSQLVEAETDNNDSEEISIWAARGILLVVAMIWATNFPAVKYLETLCFHPPCNHPPSEFAFARFGVAAVVGLPLLYKQRPDVIMAGFECGLFITLGYISQAVALSSISAGKCAFICSLTVVVVPILSALLEGKPIKPMNLVAAAMALCGVGLLEGLVDFNSLLGIAPAVADTTSTVAIEGIASSSSLESVNNVAAVASGGALASVAQTLGVSKGDIIALGQPLGFGYTFMRIEHYVEKFKDVENRVLTISAAQCVAVGFMSLLWVLYDYHGVIPNMEYLIEPHRIATIAWTGIVTTVFAIYLEGVALQTASATDAALTFSSEPVWASLFAMILLHEKLNLNAYIGGAVILIACVTGALSDIPVPTKNNDGEQVFQLEEGKDE
ncbi:EamA-like transporter family [Seminavis robusta]|uniref:EamA-like transporter family n=1 Tax=Seminavis robusta TaxID=568900 RepID=A0A9N8HNN0_9STRA|nr:EamA-like transporter family [Seminavis robusta]|eukprot:Sro1010_g230940.1 EamA-like transporter family (460) ;mRNA; f:33894-35273